MDFKLDSKEILSKLDIVNVVKNYIPLTKKGKNYVALCPFHNDSNPSLTVSPEKQIYKCFVCGEGGNAINFIQKKENISYIEALKKAAELAGIDTSKFVSTKKDKFSLQKECLNDANEFYLAMIEKSSNKDALDYCENRGLNYEIRKKFNIGFSQRNEINVIEYLKRIKDESGIQKYSYKLMEEVGLLFNKGGEYYDINFDRITFAIQNKDGQIVGFSSRYFKETNKQVSKYINTKETDIFHKTDILYNFYSAKQFAIKEKCLYIVEGFMDVIALYKANIKNAVGLMGTALTDENIQFLKNLNIEIRLCLDNDNAGQLNTLSISKKLNKFNVNYKIVKKSELAKDSDEILQKFGSEKLHEILNAFVSQQDFIINFCLTNLDMTKDEDKKLLIRNVFKEIVGLQDAIEIEIYANKLSSLTGFSKTNIEIEYNKYYKKIKSNIEENHSHNYDYSNNYANVIQTKDKDLKRIYRLEQFLIKQMLNDKEFLDYISRNDVMFVNPIYSEIYFYIRAYLSEYHEINSANILSYISEKKQNSDDITSEISNLLLEDENHVETTKYVTYLKELEFKQNIYLLENKIKNELDDNKKANLMKEKSDLILKYKEEK